MERSRACRALLWAIDDVLCRRLFPICERLGFHITLNHFYQPIPDTGKLDDELWSRQSQLVGIDINERTQMESLEQLLRFKKEYESFPKGEIPRPWQFHSDNPHFGPVDAEVLYCMIRHFKPKKLIEIGSGASTYLSAQAILRNEEETGRRAELVAIEPYANGVLKAGFPGLSRLIPRKVEDVDPAEYEALEANDILFFDTSHVLKIGGDVRHQYLEILPRLNTGVLVHIHDIFFPGEYPKSWVLRRHRFWNEQYLVQAFLAFNGAFEIIWCGSYMHLKHPDRLEQAFASYDRETIWSSDRPGATSLWIRKTT